MKHLLITMLLGLATVSAQATCFNYINGKGPSKIGNYQFAGTATQVCLVNVGRISGPDYTSLRMSDSQGNLVEAYVQKESTCRNAQFCKSLELAQGNINGRNVDLRGTTVDINASKTVLNVVQGTLSITAGRDFPQTFLIMEARR